VDPEGCRRKDWLPPRWPFRLHPLSRIQDVSRLYTPLSATPACFFVSTFFWIKFV